MKYICLGYVDDKKWEEMTKGEANARTDEIFA
jgi:hypothetical protein